MIPLNRILIETDSPYLTPEPNRGKRNDSRNVKYIAQKIADVREMPIIDIARITYFLLLDAFVEIIIVVGYVFNTLQYFMI